MKYGATRKSRRRTRPLAARVTAVSVLGVIVSVAVGCTQPSTATPAPPANSADAAAAPTVTSVIDPRWMSLGNSQLWNWELIDRTITPDFQQFGVRPLGTDQEPRKGCGCGGGGESPTAILTAFAPDKFDPTEARAGQRVTVNGREGFFLPSVDVEDAVLTWSYANDAWATIHGRASDTSELDVMVALAGDLRPTERTPVRLPLSLANVPADMPLSSIDVQHGHWPTIISFDACQSGGYGVPTPTCASTADSMSITIWPKNDDFDRAEDDGVSNFYDDAVAITVGGKEGLYEKDSNQVGVQIRPEMAAEFSLGPHGGYHTPAPSRITTKLKDVLAGVEWASDPGRDATWRPVNDWVT